jgi:hypothetical protein
LKEKGYAILKIDFVKPLPKKIGIFKMLKYGKRAIDHKKEELAPYAFDASKFDEIILGSPIWGGHISTPMYTFLSADPLKEKR